MSPLAIRNASEGDIRVVAEMHQLAFRGAIGASIGGKYRVAFFRWFLTQPDAIFLIAAQGGTDTAGYVVGAPVGYSSRLTRDLAVTMAVGLLTHPLALLHPSLRAQLKNRTLQLVGREPPVVTEGGVSYGRETFALVGIGTHPAMRRLGAARALVDAFDAEAFRRGADRVALDVFEDNAPARGLYRSCGFREVRREGRALTLEKSRA